MTRFIPSIAACLTALFLVPAVCYASEAINVRHSVSREKIRIVIELSEETPYESSHADGKFSLLMKDVKSGLNTEDLAIKDPMIQKLEMTGSDKSAKIEISLDPSAESKIFTLGDPYRIVIDLFRAGMKDLPAPPPVVVAPPAGATKTSSGIRDKSLRPVNNIADGLSLHNIEEIVHNSLIIGKALLVDPRKLDVMPVMAVSQLKARESGDTLGSLLSFLGFAPEQEIRYNHFARRTVGSFTNMYGGIAAVNGSFFFADGTPVGTLIINGQIVSSPLFNRTSLIFYENGSMAIDSVRMNGYLKVAGGKDIPISGINQPLNGNSMVVYTPDYQKTGYEGSSVNIVVSSDTVEKVSYGETEIPKNGFVVSALGQNGRRLADKLSPGTKVEWFFMTRPPLKGMKHIIAGGPRLVHSGKPCVTSKEENFRADVARSRANRTAAGITRNGDLILLTVEKTTLNELARLMIDLGAYDAMNLDGGGSSGMTVSGRTIFGGQRPVSNAIIVKNRAQ